MAKIECYNPKTWRNVMIEEETAMVLFQRQVLRPVEKPTKPSGLEKPKKPSGLKEKTDDKD